MKALFAVCALSVLSLIVLAALYLDHFGRPFLGLPTAVASATALAILAVNVVVAALAIAHRRRWPAVAWATTGLALVQVAAVLVTG